MFTGIIEEVGRILNLRLTGKTAIVEIEAGKVSAGLQLGDSVSVNGVCLTVRNRTTHSFQAEISSETLSRTSFSRMREGTRVNLERPLLSTGRLGGHFVQGHVDGMSRVTEIRQEGEFAFYRFSLPDEVRPYVVGKGSISVDGISLTVASIGLDYFEVALVPHTLEHTNLGSLQTGDEVNIECDVLAKYVESLLKSRDKPAPSRITAEYLKERGY